MRYVQIVLTDTHVDLLAGASKNAMLDTDNEQEKAQLAALTDFLYGVQANPDAFPITEPHMRAAIKKRISRLKGPPQTKPNKRKRAQLRSQGSQKRTRAQRREEAALQREQFAQFLREEQERELAAERGDVQIVLPPGVTE